MEHTIAIFYIPKPNFYIAQKVHVDIIHRLALIKIAMAIAEHWFVSPAKAM
jgi:hypothetical protein